MSNLVAAAMSLLHCLVKMAGLRPHSVEIEPGTVMSFWIRCPPKEKRKGESETKKRPAVVLIHGFAADGLVTWLFQIGALTKKYDVYVPDLLFFGGSATSSGNRSPAFRAECLARALRSHLGVHSCTAVGFSYGGMVAFKMAELYPQLVSSLVISGFVIAMTKSISEIILQSLGFSSFSEMLLPSDVKGLKALLSVGSHKKLWFPSRFHKDYLEVMFTNRKEKSELLESLVISNKEARVPSFPQTILLLWGENDQIFNIERAKIVREQLGDKAIPQGIKKAGHLVHLERPCVYNRCLKEFLADCVQANGADQG